MTETKSEHERIVEENDRALRLFDRWHQFIQIHAQTVSGKQRTAWHIAMTMLVFRSIECLDSVRVLTLAGRPVQAEVIFRGVYESWLNLLTLAYHSGTIHRDHLKPPPKGHGPKHRAWWQSPTREQLALRYVAFGWHAELESAEQLVKNDIEWQRIAAASNLSLTSLASIPPYTLKRGTRARTVFGFSIKNNNWLPFKSVRDQREHLWPLSTGGPPKFPNGIVPMDEVMWRDLYFTAYRMGSHFVHGSSAVFGSIGRPAHLRTAHIDCTPYEDARALMMTNVIVSLCTATFADAMGSMNTWNITVGAK